MIAVVAAEAAPAFGHLSAGPHEAVNFICAGAPRSDRDVGARGRVPRSGIMPKRCGRLLMVFVPPALTVNGHIPDIGRLEIRCRDCRTVNFIQLSDCLPRKIA